MDVSDPASVKAGVEAAQAAFGPIDILVSNAGICKLGDFLTQSDEDRDAHLDINVKGAWNTCKAVIPGMLERKWGKIVIMSSVTGDMVADPGEAAYAMSKAALVGLTKALAREFAPTINVNAICPGYVLTPMVKGMAQQSCPDNPQSVIDGIASAIPLGRLADPTEVASWPPSWPATRPAISPAPSSSLTAAPPSPRPVPWACKAIFPSPAIRPGIFMAAPGRLLPPPVQSPGGP